MRHQWGALMLLPVGLRIYRESWVPDWEMHRYPVIYPDVVFAGRDRYAHLLYELEVKPRLLVTDPGPLDARVW